MASLPQSGRANDPSHRSDVPAGSAVSTITWGLFAASSWTWCIGMFLPVILLERAGWTAFFAFAIPNVLGCAALGFLFRSAAASEQFTRRHRDAASFFSAVTIAYHLFFTCFFVLVLAPRFGSLERFAPPANAEWLSTALPALGAAFLVLAIGRLLAQFGDRTWAWLGTLCWCISIGVLLLIAWDPSRLGDLAPRFGPGHALLLAPVAIFGFLLCPYLDLTFHRARQRSGSNRSSIVLGFGFASMLVVTVVAWFRDADALGAAVILHLCMQGVFTVGAHLRELLHRAADLLPRTRLLCTGIIVLGPAAGLLLLLPGGDGAVNGASDTGSTTLIAGETIYLWFLSAYGLVFPAYVLVFAAPRIAIPRTPRSVAIFLLMLLLAAPLYEVGFVQERPVALIAPMLVAAAFIAIRLAATRR